MGKASLVVRPPKPDPSTPIHIEYDLTDLQKLEALFPELSKEIVSAYIRSLKRALTSGEAYAAKLYQISYPGVKQSLIKDKYIKQYGNWAAKSLDEVGASLSISGKGVLLEHFRPKRTDRGVSYIANMRTVEISRAFYAKVFKANKGPHWWRRSDKAVEEKKRFPLEIIFGPSPYDVFKREENRAAVAERIIESLNSNIPSQLNYYLTRAFYNSGIKPE